MTDQGSKSGQSRLVVGRRFFIGGTLIPTAFDAGVPIYERAVALTRYGRFLQAQTTRSLDNTILWDNKIDTFENVAQADSYPDSGRQVLSTRTERTIVTINILIETRLLDRVVEKFGMKTGLLGISIGDEWTITDTVFDFCRKTKEEIRGVILW